MKKSLLFKSGTIISNTDIIGTPWGISKIIFKAAGILIVSLLNAEIAKRNNPI